MKKYSVSIRLLIVKNISHTDLRTSQAHFSEKGCQHKEKDYENKILSLKEYITGEEVKIIEIIFLFACMQAECEQQGSQLQCLLNWSIA